MIWRELITSFSTTLSGYKRLRSFFLFRNLINHTLSPSSTMAAGSYVLSGGGDGSEVVSDRTKISVCHKETIGKGSFGRVKYCVAEVDGRRLGFAVKIIDKKRTNSSAIMREVSILEKVRHTNLITFVKISDQQHRVYLYMEYCKNGDLARMIKNNGPYTERNARHLFVQIVAAIEYLHGIDVAHRDLKPENVLLNHLNQVKVADFGLAAYIRNPMNGRRTLAYSRCGTEAYMPPEVLSNSREGYNSTLFDIWSMGGVLHFMLTGEVPFVGKRRSEILAHQLTGNIFLFRPEHVLTVTASVKKLIRLMLEPDVLKRARIPVVKRSEWMNLT